MKAYTLSTCPHCRMTKEFLNDNNVDFEYVDVDLLTGEKRSEVLREVFKLTGAYSFPVIVVGDAVIVGFNRDKLQHALELT
ncbi:MAG: glutaredoxin family protein [Halobacteriota archaeon]